MTKREKTGGLHGGSLGSGKTLGVWSATAVVVGSMLGIGIYIVPPQVAELAGGSWWFFGLWFFGGVVAFAGADAFAQLSTRVPKAGGDFCYQYLAFGPSVAFATGCVLFLGVFGGSIAATALPLWEFQLAKLAQINFTEQLISSPFGGGVSVASLGGISLILLVTAVHLGSERNWSRLQVVLTLVPLVLLSFIACYALIAAPSAVHATAEPGAMAEEVTVSRLLSAYLGVYFAYSGWNAVTYVAGEVKDPSKTLPRALLGGTIATTLLYLLLCGAYVHVLGMPGLAQSSDAGSAMTSVLGGVSLDIVSTILITLALLASLNACISGGARIAYAMAREGVLWAPLGEVSGERGLPRNALIFQAAWSSLLVWTGGFVQLIQMTSLAMLVTGGISVLSLFVLCRRDSEFRQHDGEPYRSRFFPWLPLFYLLVSLTVCSVKLFDALRGEPGAWYTLLGLGIFVACLVGHFLWTRPVRDTTATHHGLAADKVEPSLAE